jgi:hypothetical protein
MCWQVEAGDEISNVTPAFSNSHRPLTTVLFFCGGKENL